MESGRREGGTKGLRQVLSLGLSLGLGEGRLCPTASLSDALQACGLPSQRSLTFETVSNTASGVTSPVTVTWQRQRGGGGNEAEEGRQSGSNSSEAAGGPAGVIIVGDFAG